AVGLLKAVEMEIDRIREAARHMNLKLAITGEPTAVSDEKELLVYRILQEGLANVIKHAAATEVCVSFVYTAQTRQVTISDNGKGFDVEQVTNARPHAGAGLKNMLHRARLFQGTLTIKSKVTDGTKIALTIPINGHS